ncbi:MAG: DUF4968 domain-containing protein [Bacteroidetes bacterium]|nr:MAG: DUF4968 domain-containing protein [Bacteroidota bacterium]
MENKKPVEQEPVEQQETADQPKVIALREADVSQRYEDVFETIAPDEITSVGWQNGAYEFVCQNGVRLRLQVIASGIVRLRYSPDGIFQPDHSYGLRPDLSPEKITATLNESEQEYILSCDPLQIVVAKSGARVRFYDPDDRLLQEDAEGFSARRTVMEGWTELKLRKKYQRKEVFYGLGDKACGPNLAGRTFQNWCEDAFGYGRETDPLYRAVPFFYGLHQGLAYGIFLDNTFRTHFDFNSSENDTVSFWADGGELNYYFIYGPGLTDVSRAYSWLTGTAELPPLWALGFHQCRWSYYPHSKVVEIADKFRELDIPCDAIYLDIDYMDAFRCFTWNKEHFPDPKGLISELWQKGFQTVVMINPGIKEDPDYPVYREGVEKNLFLRSSNGDIAKGPVWPGFCAFPDFTLPEARDWWGPLYRGLYLEDGVSGFWNDMNEPAVLHVANKTLPDHVLHNFDGHISGHRKAHNVYGMQMARASWDGLRTLQPEKRPFLLTRASYSGGQRYAAVWTGDNQSSWEHLAIANVQCQRLSISGFSLCGSDIGGFAGASEGELFIRWLQLGVFHPLMRVHHMGNHAGGDIAVTDDAQLTDPALHTSDQEPWSFGEKWTDLAKKAIELRYALLPCLYTAVWQYTQTGTPVLRHAGFADHEDSKLWEMERDFMFGEHLFVSPVVQPKLQRQLIYLPKGDWYYFWTGQPASGELFVNIMPEQIPFFVRAGSVLPTYPVRQYTGESAVDELTLYVYFNNGKETSTMYEDEGEGYAYQDNEYCLRKWITDGDKESFTLTQQITGSWEPPYEKIKIFLVGFPTYLKKCEVDDSEMPIKEIRLRDRALYTMSIPPNFKTIKWHA